MTRPARSAAALCLATVVAVASCGGPTRVPTSTAPPSSPAPTSSPTPAAPDTGAEYVALGDSYTAGGFIEAFQSDGFRCQRSAVNYPTLTALALGLALTDVSCGGADTTSVLESSRGLPAQVDALTKRTRAVTLGIGGNDFGLFGRLILTCPEVSRAGGAGTPCRDQLGADANRFLPEIDQRIGAVLAEVRRRAPKAQVVLVGYPRLMPTSKTCANAPYTSGDVAWIATLEASLSEAMAAAARSAGVDFVPMYQRSKGHDLCAVDAAWVNGLDPANGDGVILHPNAAGERAMAAAVQKVLRKAGSG